MIKVNRDYSIYRPPPEVKELIKRTASSDLAIAGPALREQAKALQEIIRRGIMNGDVIYAANIFEPFPIEQGDLPRFALDILAPGTEKDYNAYNIPLHGRIPERTVEGEFIQVSTYRVGNSIDWPLRLVQNGTYNIVARALEIYEAGFVKKANDDGFKTLIFAAADRNQVISDPAAPAGKLSLKLITMMQQFMRRNGGGNGVTPGGGRLTDIFASIEAVESLRELTVAEIDEVTWREIFTATDGTLSSLYGVRLHSLYELGVGQEYQNFYLDDNGINGDLAASDTELVIGLDLSNQDAFVNPIVQEMEVFEDITMHRSQRAGVYGWAEHGFCCTDNRRVVLASI